MGDTRANETISGSTNSRIGSAPKDGPPEPEFNEAIGPDTESSRDSHEIGRSVRAAKGARERCASPPTSSRANLGRQDGGATIVTDDSLEEELESDRESGQDT